MNVVDLIKNKHRGRIGQKLLAQRFNITITVYLHCFVCVYNVAWILFFLALLSAVRHPAELKQGLLALTKRKKNCELTKSNN